MEEPMDAPAAGTCEVWVARVSATVPYAAPLAAVLDGAERARVARLMGRRQRDRALSSFGILRLLLGRYLSRRPADVPLDRSCATCGDPHGPPRLAPPNRLRFSVAHSGDVLVFAFVRAQPVGVDVEAARPLSPPPGGELLSAALTGAERRHVESLPAAARWPGFLRYWTHKEAVLKSIGTGLAVDPTSVEIAGKWARFVAAEAGRSPVWVCPLDLGGYPAAVASTGPLDPVTVQPFTEDLLITTLCCAKRRTP
jgi:4'-phosphopantetheinyl transferase